MIACVLIPHFAAAVEGRDDPSLAAAPLVVGGSGKVFAVSEVASAMGVAPGMRLRQARTLCPQARFIPPDPARYQRTFETLLDTLERFTPRLEAGQVHPSATSWLDLGRLAPREATGLAQDVGRAVRQVLGLAPALGLAGGKFPALVAAGSVAPNRALLVPPGDERRFLASFPVDALPLEREMARRLGLLGVHTLGQLAGLPAGAILTQFGPDGRALHRLARGEPEGPIRPRRPERVARVLRQLDGPVADRLTLEAILGAIAVELGERLRVEGLVGQGLQLALGLEDGTLHEERLMLRQPSGDPARLALTLGELASRAAPGRGVAEIEVTLTSLTPARGQQLDLFVHQTGQDHRLREALGDLAARYGSDCFYQFSLLDRAIPLPERRFRLRQATTP
jgi:DNA polymerase-4